MGHLAESLQLGHRAGELVGARLDLIEQPHVLDRDHRLVGEGRDELDLLVGERPYLRSVDAMNADRARLLAAGERQANVRALPNAVARHCGLRLD